MSIVINLEGRVALVCGAARVGISGATARLLAATGATVAVADVSQVNLDHTVSDIEAAGGRCHGILADLTNPEDTDKIVEHVWSTLGRLDYVANVAGGTGADEWRPLEDTPTDMFRKTLNLNLEYVFRICRDAAKSMIRRDTPGAIVNIGSISAIAGAPYHGPYGAAKSGIAALTRTMAFEWAKYGIRANTVQPGAVPSERVMSRQPVAAAGQKKGMASSGVIPTDMDELANTIVFLLSDLASGITGQTISVDSGMSTKFCGGARPFENSKRLPQS